MELKIQDLKIGDEIVISRKPRTWSSDLNSNCPLFKNNIIYPYTCVIKDIKKINGDKDYTSMTCGKYGWSLDSLIKENLITKINKTDMKEPRPYNLISEVTYEMITTHPYFKTLSYTGLYNIVNSINNRTYHRLIGNSVREKTELLLEQFKENPSQKIIGYKLTKPEYMEFANVLVKEKTTTHIYKTDVVVELSYHKDAFLIWEKAGVLDLWFEPVYEIKEEKFEVYDWVTVISDETYNYGHSCGQEKPIIGNSYQVSESLMEGYITLSVPNSNWEKISLKASDLRKATPEEIESATQETIHMAENFDLTIKNKRVYHKTEDITTYVKAMGEWYYSIPTSLDKYHFQIDDITLRRTGCQPKTTSIKQWLEIYEKIK